MFPIEIGKPQAQCFGRRPKSTITSQGNDGSPNPIGCGVHQLLRFLFRDVVLTLARVAAFARHSGERILVDPLHPHRISKMLPNFLQAFHDRGGGKPFVQVVLPKLFGLRPGDRLQRLVFAEVVRQIVFNTAPRNIGGGLRPRVCRDECLGKSADGRPLTLWNQPHGGELVGQGGIEIGNPTGGVGA
ncbi:MAG: hypothetical protein ABFC63_07585 [Thermoguttaceae bacterium]